MKTPPATCPHCGCEVSTYLHHGEVKLRWHQEPQRFFGAYLVWVGRRCPSSNQTLTKSSEAKA